MPPRLRLTCLFAAALPFLAAGCRPEAPPQAPLDPRTLQDRTSYGVEERGTSGVLGRGDVHTIIAAFGSGKLDALRAWMTKRARRRAGARKLRRKGDRLRREYGEPAGIIEERVHLEGPLLWYSGLVAYVRTDGKQTPILYQFAVNSEGELERLLVREHRFLQGSKPPAEEYEPVTRFHFPARGRWYVVHGGRKRKTNYHHGSKNQRFAYDLVVKQNDRQRRPGRSKTRNDSYYCYGKDLLAPAAGTVVTAINDVPENVPGRRGRAGGNGVVIDHGFGEYSALWHAIPGTVTVRVGDAVEVGQVIGKVGNSGRSTMPHIHFHVSYRSNASRDQFGLPAPFTDVYVDDEWHAEFMPKRGQYVESASSRGKKLGRKMRKPVLLDF